jgi:hypothetical protein
MSAHMTNADSPLLLSARGYLVQPAPHDGSAATVSLSSAVSAATKYTVVSVPERVGLTGICWSACRNGDAGAVKRLSVEGRRVSLQ